MPDKRFARYLEAAFDAAYLLTALALGMILLFTGETPLKRLFGVMALVLFSGDACHLVPRVLLALTGDEARLKARLGYGKMAASIGMTFFYVLLWHAGLLAFHVSGARVVTAFVYLLAAVRILLCLFPQNRWREGGDGPWGVYRNIPFTLLGAAAGVLFFLYRRAEPIGLSWMWLAVLLSFAFYLPVVLWAEKRPALGMLMLPKTCAYVWIIAMGLMV
ncbi:MAG: hypothetical protein ABFC62_02935 [Clostridiaceae bacterium]|nr:hypothetical protein [Eubacteriales bacterium]